MLRFSSEAGAAAGHRPQVGQVAGQRLEQIGVAGERGFDGRRAAVDQLPFERDLFEPTDSAARVRGKPMDQFIDGRVQSARQIGQHDRAGLAANHV